MFEGFTDHEVPAARGPVFARVGGDGPPLLLLHGYLGTRRRGHGARVFGSQDRNIPAGVHRIMADRAGSRRTVEIDGASHVVGISHVAEVADVVLGAVDRTTVAT